MWSHHHMKVANFQHAHPSRYVIQQRLWHERIPTLRTWKDFSAAWPEVSGRPDTTQSVETPQRTLQDKKGLVQTCTRQNFFKVYSPVEEANTPMGKPIIKWKDRMYIVDSGASLRMVGENVLSLRRKRKTLRQTNDCLEIHATNDIVRFTREARGLHPGA